MSRLLHAAARGARIQFWADPVKLWGTVGITFAGSAHELRIHPEDVHLAYGPISTALREGADQYGGGKQPSGLGRMLAQPFIEYHRRGCGKIDDELHRSLFLLILAEALAEEGL